MHYTSKGYLTHDIYGCDCPCHTRVVGKCVCEDWAKIHEGWTSQANKNTKGTQDITVTFVPYSA